MKADPVEGDFSEEWLNDVARRAADDEDAFSANRPAWLDHEDETSALIESSSDPLRHVQDDDALVQTAKREHLQGTS